MSLTNAVCSRFSVSHLEDHTVPVIFHPTVASLLQITYPLE